MTVFLHFTRITLTQGYCKDIHEVINDYSPELIHNLKIPIRSKSIYVPMQTENETGRSHGSSVK